MTTMHDRADRPRLTPGPRRASLSSGWARQSGILGITLALCLAMLLGTESIVYKAGLVLIFFVAAIGLHILVNWAGQLSLAHTSMVGIPAFAMLGLSATYHVSPIYLLPAGAVLGMATGMVFALATLRAGELQVALMTMVGSVGLDFYLFSQPWFVGGALGRNAAVPAIGSLRFTDSHQLYPLLLLFVVLASAAAWALRHSKAARAWAWVKDNPDAAAAFGIPVVRYRILAYLTAGAFAGFGGGLTAMWVQNFGQEAFPDTLSFSYLVVVVLAGPGFLGGVAVATLVLQGGQQFEGNLFGVIAAHWVDAILAYGGALGAIDMIARHPGGLNGFGHILARRLSRLPGTRRAGGAVDGAVTAAGGGS